MAARFRILLCNPNSSEFMTQKCIEMVQGTLPSDVDVVGFTCPKPGPSAIEGASDAIFSTAASLRAIISLPPYSAYLVACYSDHPLIYALREETSAPVCGIMEASLYFARILGGRVGIVTTGYRSGFAMEESVKKLGFDAGGKFVGVQSTGLGVLELESRPQEEVVGKMVECARSLVGRGADVVCLGCAGMTELKKAVEDGVGEDVQVLDGVLCGVQFLVGVCRVGGKTAKRGVYASAREGREARGQDWL